MLKRVLAEIVQLKEQVGRMADALQRQEDVMKCLEDRKKYHADYYKKRKVARAKRKVALSNKLLNRDKHCLDSLRDTRVPYDKWTEKLKAFSARGLSAYNFITWLAWEWNHNTYVHVPITRSGGYVQVFIGLSGGKPLRNKYSDRDLTGRMRITKFQKPEQLDTFSDALWWKWTFRALVQVVNNVSETNWYKALGDSWDRPLKVAMGCFGCYEIKGVTFDHTERDLAVMSKAYGYLRPTLEMCWGAFLRGLFSKVEPFVIAE